MSMNIHFRGVREIKIVALNDYYVLLAGMVK